MDESKSTVNWIEAYLEWTNIEGWTSGPGPLAGSAGGEVDAHASGQFAAAYLDWMDAGQDLRAPGPRYHAGVFAGDAAGIGDEPRGLELFRDALTVALHTESDCMRFLRRILDAGDTSAPTLKLAVECLEHAERLLEDERRARRRWTAAQAPESAAGVLSVANPYRDELAARP